MNVFSEEYTQSEISKYGRMEYNKNGIVIKKIVPEGRVDQYLSMSFSAGGFEYLTFLIDGKVWMSLTPMEIQSHVVPIKKAVGRVAVGGIGMGYYLQAIMGKENVSHIDVYEIDDRVIDYFKERFSNRDGFDKINFILGDMREFCIGKTYDFAYVDIYPTMLPAVAMDDLYEFCGNNNIQTYHYWGQERILIEGVFAQYLEVDALDYDNREFLEQFIEDETRANLHNSLCMDDFLEDWISNSSGTVF